MDNVPPEKEIVIAFTGALSYGIYLLTLCYCLRWLLFSDEGWTARRRRNWPMIAITLSTFTLVTAYLALLLYKNTKTLHDIINHIPPSNTEGRVPWTSTVICVLANMSALLADIALMYRVWVVYGKRKRVLIFPSIMWITGLVCTVLQGYWQIVHSNVNEKWNIVNMSIGPGMILTPFWATTLLLNLYCMSLLMYRIWSAAKKSHGLANVRTLQFTMRILAESGFLYFSTTIAHFIVWFTPNDLAIRIASEINIPTIGIAFNLILIRVGYNRAREHASGAVEDYTGRGVSVMRYANNTDEISVCPKIIIDISQETSMVSEDV
ncbi:hypothetical protein BDN70DRAFT_929607 [Pholiota conissans]|uniref:Uncharacterized protein n=1 Tax=Pholiota conissans TaxID=109636 RepID=A0A9P5Z997_9AGAR|nr:hypothetical protein BDN70DRAFT_929607 [Pholiota conissans]